MNLGIRLFFLSVAALIAATFSITGCFETAVPLDLETYGAEIEEWRRDRDASLRRPDGWLTLVGLFWLHNGENTFGSAADNDAVFPADAPPHMGSIVRDTTGARLEAVPGLGVLVDGKKSAQSRLNTDIQDSTTIMTWHSLIWYLVERDGRIGIRLKDTLSVERQGFSGMEYFELDPQWRLRGRFESFDPPREIEIPTVLGTTASSISPGRIIFEAGGQSNVLDVTGDPDDEQYFLVFGDLSNGRETYGGGRFLVVDAQEKDGSIVIDFNRAYNPPCVFSPYATCPLPPPQNKLAIAISAGEKNYQYGVGHSH